MSIFTELDILRINTIVNELVWGIPFLLLFIGTGLFLTICLRFFQFTHFITAWKETLFNELLKKGDKKSGGSITGFQAISSAMAATLGIGNIAGVATALHLGGPGAIFWMWVTAVVGMATKFSEAILSVKFREKKKNEVFGGVMYYIQNGLGGNWIWLAVLYALFAGVAALGTGNMVQSNTVAHALLEDFGIPKIVTGIVSAFLIGLVILGGIKRIAQVASILVPLMTLAYVIGALFILYLNYPEIPGAFRDIIYYAFNPYSAASGAAGFGVMHTIKVGIARGIFLNEAGLGAGSIVHAQAKNTPTKQGMWGIWEVFIDTMVVGTITALVILVSGALETGKTGAVLTSEAFDKGLPGSGGYFITIAIIIFACTTMITWSFYGEKSWEYLFGKRIKLLYRLIFIVLIVLGAVGKLEEVWTFADTMNGLMALPNLIALNFLSKVIVRQKNKYLKGKEVF
ncbi:alanine/glycine:cation symporter family protein [Natranaerobius trueperi]|uniref:Sodium:alanine symporter family protein n=1 Tax=Natranaerobius trueperi TaxID=759412 RepID=A0A226BV63_9FIRM|nr:sodium:alanine symporter family protein [Natranaerobius trueperi]OWZ82886.1 sodium:alanine symporter family protein [Natranaerobius trueperi]